MEKRIIARGLLAGAIGGVVAYLFARIFRTGDRSRHRLRSGASAPGHEEGAELFTRAVQANVGLGFGVVAFAVAMGAFSPSRLWWHMAESVISDRAHCRSRWRPEHLA